MRIVVELKGGAETELVAEKMMAHVDQGVLVVNCVAENGERTEYCWPPTLWEGYELEEGQ